MSRAFVLLFLAFTLATAGARAQSQTPTVSVLASDPGLSGTLHRDTALYLRLSYSSEVPLRLQAQGYFKSELVTAGARWNPAPPYPAGEGEAVVWLAHAEPVKLDEIRISVADGEWRELKTLSLRVNVEWTADRAHEPQRAPWVERLSGAQQSAVSPAARDVDPNSLEVRIFGMLAMLAMLSVPGYFVLQVWLARSWSGGWRLASLLPLAVMLPVGLHALFALLAGSNIWPLLVILTAPLACLFLVVLLVTRSVREAIA